MSGREREETFWVLGKDEHTIGFSDPLRFAKVDRAGHIIGTVLKNYSLSVGVLSRFWSIFSPVFYIKVSNNYVQSSHQLV
jgi:hypothetical protein